MGDPQPGPVQFELETARKLQCAQLPLQVTVLSALHYNYKFYKLFKERYPTPHTKSKYSILARHLVSARFSRRPSISSRPQSKGTRMGPSAARKRGV